jgi:hypothetical protein
LGKLTDNYAGKYDVAISFLSADEPIAAALYDTLSDGLDVFFYPRRQEELAGTDGMESMRAPFYEESRVVVVLYREPWGKTPWTRIEETAIKDGCFKHGWRGLFFIMLDDSRPPLWLPETRVRFNYNDFGFEGAVGAIKARVLETGGSITLLTALKRAALAKQETEYLKEKQILRSAQSVEPIRRSTLELFSAIELLCVQINASGMASLQVASDAQQCHLRNNRVSLVASLLEAHSGATLVVRDFSKRLAFRGERLCYLDGEPVRLQESSYLPDINRAREHGWIDAQHAATFLSTEVLADRIVCRFIDLSVRADRGQINARPAAMRRVRARFDL